MRLNVRTLLLVAALCGIPTMVAAADNSLVTGVWRGKIDDLPGITMVISDEGGTLTGAVVFYLIRSDTGQAPRSSPGDPEPMFDVKFDEHVLDFKVSHRRAHPPRTLHDPPVTFHLKLTGKDQGALTRNDEKVSVPVSRDK